MSFPKEYSVQFSKVRTTLFFLLECIRIHRSNDGKILDDNTTWYDVMPNAGTAEYMYLVFCK